MKNITKRFRAIAFIMAAGFFFTGCFEEYPLTVEFTVSIENTSSDQLDFEMQVSTQNGIDDPKNGYIYTTDHFGRDDIPYTNSTEENIKYYNKNDLKIAAGATSEKFGPFRVAFKDDRANPSAIRVVIKKSGGSSYDWGSNTPSISDGYWPADVPGNFALKFDGTELKR